MKVYLKLVAFALFAFPSLCRADGVDPEKLRSLLKLPQIELRLELTTIPVITALTGWEQPASNPRAEIPKLLKQLKGNANDAAIHCQLGELYSGAKEAERSKEHYLKAVSLYRQLLAKRPEDARLMLQFGEALDGAGRKTEAEVMFRRVTKLAPDLWEGWAKLGKTMADRFFPMWLKRLGDANKDWKPSQEIIAKLRRIMDESQHCIDRAVRVAPNLPGPYKARIEYNMTSWMMSLFTQAAQQQKPEESKPDWRALVRSPEALRDVRKVADICRDDPGVQFNWATREMLSGYQGPDTNLSNLWAMWYALPETSRQSVREATARLLTIAECKDPQKAGKAAMYAGVLYFYTGNQPGAEQMMRRAVSLDSSQEDAFEALVGIFGEAKRFADLVALLQERLAYKDSARYRFLLAKVHYGLNETERAETELRAALKLEPKDFHANLGLGVTLLKRGAKPEEAQPFIEAALAKLPSGKEAAEAHTALAVTFALEGKMGQAEQELQQAKKFDKNYEPIEEIAKELGVDTAGPMPPFALRPDDFTLQQKGGASVAAEGSSGLRVAVSGGIEFSVWLYHKTGLRRDFEAEIEFRFTKLDSSAATATYFSLSVTTQKTAKEYHYLLVTRVQYLGRGSYTGEVRANDSPSVMESRPTEDRRGKLRIVRQGDQVSTYFWQDNTWQSVGTHSLPAEEELFLVLSLGNDYPGVKEYPDAEVVVKNLTVSGK